MNPAAPPAGARTREDTATRSLATTAPPPGPVLDLDSLARRPPPPQAGQDFGAYRLEHELGSGGMGTVWLARRIDGRFEGSVAIKLLREGLLDAGDTERFAREGRILARLNHPGIARLLDAGLSPEHGQPYLVIEHIEGRPIDQHAVGLGREPRAVVTLFLQVLEAVSHAHKHLILHRDLKPSNVLVTPAGQVKLLDFGVAKLLADGSEAPELTRQQGLQPFTPQFAAPEQLLGQEAGTATDVYGLGVMLFLLLSGDHPTPPAESGALARLRAVVETPPRRLSEVALQAGGPGARRRARLLRGDLDLILARALRKAPEQRYAHAASLAEDLRHWLANEPIQARPEHPAYLLAKFVRRHRLAVAAGSLALLGLGLSAALALQQAQRAEEQRRQAESLIGFMLDDLGSKLEPLGRLDVMDGIGNRALGYFAGQKLDRLGPEALRQRTQALSLLTDIQVERGQLVEVQRSLAEAERGVQLLLRRAPHDPATLDLQTELIDRHVTLSLHLARPDGALRKMLGLQQQLTDALRRSPQDITLQVLLLSNEINLGIHALEDHRSEEALRRVTLADQSQAGLPIDRAGLSRFDRANTQGWLARIQQARGALDAAHGHLQALRSQLRDTPGSPADHRRDYLLAVAALVEAELRLAQGRLGEARTALDTGLRSFDELLRIEPTNRSNLWQQSLALLLHARLEGLAGQPRAARAALDRVAELLARGRPPQIRSSDWDLSLAGLLLSARAELDPRDPSLPRALDDWLGELAWYGQEGRMLIATQRQVAAEVSAARARVHQVHGEDEAADRAWTQVLHHSADAVRDGRPEARQLQAEAQLARGDRAGARALVQALQASGWGHPRLAALQRQLGAAPDSAAGAPTGGGGSPDTAGGAAPPP